MNGVLTAIGLAIDILGAVIALQEQLKKVSEMVKKAQDEGRDLTDEELALLRAARNAARQAALDA